MKDITKEVIAQGWTSRKYRTAWYLTVIILLMYVIPPVFSILKLGAVSFTLLSEGGFLAFLSGLWGTYFGLNIIEKLKFNAPVSEKIASSGKRCENNKEQE